MARIITNNPEVIRDFPDAVVVDGEFRDVLTAVRDLVYKGHKLITHPLPASSRMFPSPVRTVLVSDTPGKLDEMSAITVSKSIELYDKRMKNNAVDRKNEKDYGVIDYDLLKTALTELGN